MRYLFPKLAGNRMGTRAWETSHYDGMLRKLSGVLELRDASGRPLSYSRSHLWVPKTFATWVDSRETPPLGSAPGGRRAGLHPAVRAMIFGLRA